MIGELRDPRDAAHDRVRRRRAELDEYRQEQAARESRAGRVNFSARYQPVGRCFPSRERLHAAGRTVRFMAYHNFSPW